MRELALEGRATSCSPGGWTPPPWTRCTGGRTCSSIPSLYEGFGLPVLEAMARGAPCVVSTSSSLPEVAGEAALPVDPRSVAGLAEAMERVSHQPVLAERLRQVGRAGQRSSRGTRPRSGPSGCTRRSGEGLADHPPSGTPGRPSRSSWPRSHGTRAPEEVVVVDGGSTDGTFEVLSGTAGITLLREPGANISRGGTSPSRRRRTTDRGHRRRLRAGAGLASSGCSSRSSAGPDVAAGFYEPIATPCSRCVRGGVSRNGRGDLGLDAFVALGGLPPEAWEAAAAIRSGWTSVRTCTSTTSGARRACGWTRRRTAVATGAFGRRPRRRGRQYVRYAEATLAGMSPSGTPPGSPPTGSWPRRCSRGAGGCCAASAVGGGCTRGSRCGETLRRLPVGSPDRAKVVVGVPAVIAFTDAAKMWGYLWGACDAAERQPSGI
jgi:hypothetical protein